MNYAKFLLSLYILGLAGLVNAEERWFQIEVIVFDQQSADALKAELWQPQVPRRPSYQIDFLTDIESASPEMLRAGVTQLFLYPDLSMTPGQSVAQDDDSTGNTQVSTIDLSPTADNEAPQKTEQPFINLAAENRNLMDVYRKLQRSSRIKVLNYASWRQPVGDPDSAIEVRIYGGTNYIERFDENGALRTLQGNGYSIDWSDSQQELQPVEIIEIPEFEPLDVSGLFEKELSQLATTSEEVTESDFDFRGFLNQYMQRAEAKAEILTKPSLWQLDGAISVYIEKRYLHLKSDLVYRKPVLPSEFDYIKKQQWQLEAQQSPANITEQNATDSVAQQPPQLELINIDQSEKEAVREFSIQNLRRLRSTEYHYVDHPLVGMVFLITPYLPEHLKPQEEQEN